MPTLDFLSEQQRKFFEELPGQVQVFRSCSRPRVCGIAWTTDRIIAEGFARGHRGIFVTDDRNEKEIVLNPRRLRRLVVEEYLGRDRGTG